MRSIGSVLVLISMASVLGPAVTAEENVAAPDVPNVLITFTVGRIEAGGDVPVKSYSLLAAGDGSQAEMMTGARVPIPVSRGGGDADHPVTSFSYQNVGFTASVEAHVLPDGKIKLAGNIEDSSLSEPNRPGGPIIQTLDQRLVAVLSDGVPLRINSIEEADTRSLYIEIKADRQQRKR